MRNEFDKYSGLKFGNNYRFNHRRMAIGPQHFPKINAPTRKPKTRKRKTVLPRKLISSK